MDRSVSSWTKLQHALEHVQVAIELVPALVQPRAGTLDIGRSPWVVHRAPRGRGDRSSKISLSVPCTTSTEHGLSAPTDLGADRLAPERRDRRARRTLVSRHADALDTAVLSIGQFHAGTSDIVIAETVEMRGAVRTLLPRTHDRLASLFRPIVENTAAAQRLQLDLDYNAAYPPTINSTSQAELADRLAAEVVGEDGIKRNLASPTAGENFSYMLREVPGAFLLLARRTGKPARPPPHNGFYDFNDDLLPVGPSCLVRLRELELQERRR